MQHTSIEEEKSDIVSDISLLSLILFNAEAFIALFLEVRRMEESEEKLVGLISIEGRGGKLLFF
jgi:hypothetical protein